MLLRFSALHNCPMAFQMNLHDGPLPRVLHEVAWMVSLWLAPPYFLLVLASFPISPSVPLLQTLTSCSSETWGPFTSPPERGNTSALVQARCSFTEDLQICEIFLEDPRRNLQLAKPLLGWQNCSTSCPALKVLPKLR